MSKVAVGLPTLDAARYLPRAIESLLIQSYEAFRIVLVDDCSTDATPEVAQRYAALDPRVVYRRNPQRLGRAANRRRAHELATLELGPFDYFCWAGDRDVWHPSRLEALVAELDADPALVGAFSLAGRLDADDRVLPAHEGSDRDLGHGLFRAEAIRRAGGYPDAVDPDRLLAARLALLGPVAQVERVLRLERDGPAAPTRLLAPALDAPRLFRWVDLDSAVQPTAGLSRRLRIVATYVGAATAANAAIRTRQARQRLGKPARELRRWSSRARSAGRAVSDRARRT